MNQKTKNFTKRFEWDEKITSPHPQPSAWFLPINVRAMASPLTPALRQKSALLNEKRREQSAAFTLAETLITVVILGILAAILVPNLIKNQVENANRTKVKKAMAAYEKAINYIIIENDIKSFNGIKDFGEEETCKYASEYFKKVQKYGDTDCVFKTPDRVWWNISDLSNPIIILKEELKVKNPDELRILAKDFNDKNVFALVGRFDEVGSLRVDDNGFEQSQKNNNDNKLYMAKLWGFINNLKVELTGLAKCNAEGKTTCTITTSDGREVTYTKVTATSDASVNYQCKYKDDRENRVDNTQDCSGHTSTAPAGDYWISQTMFTNYDSSFIKSDEVCLTSTRGYSSCKNKGGDYHEAARVDCQKAGGHLASLAELEIARQNKIIKNSSYWSSEEFNSGLTSAYILTVSNGSVFGINKSSGESNRFICISE